MPVNRWKDGLWRPFTPESSRKLEDAAEIGLQLFGTKNPLGREEAGMKACHAAARTSEPGLRAAINWSRLCPRCIAVS